MIKMIEGMWLNPVIRYLFFGGCTTLVNMISFYILRRINVGLNAANLTAIILAILFAYVVNSRYVFKSKYNNRLDYVKSFVKFIGARVITMVIEVVGVWMFVEVINMQEMIGKFLIQFVVIVLNYLLSKLFVFVKN